MDYELLRKELSHDEGLRLKPYHDSVGKLTIGVGRNLDDRGITRDEAMMMLDNDIDDTIKELNHLLPWWSELTEPRQRVLVNMLFNMGWGDGMRGLSSFKKTLKFIETGKYGEAAVSMLQSKWARQVGMRAVRLAKMMEEG